MGDEEKIRNHGVLQNKAELNNTVPAKSSNRVIYSTTVSVMAIKIQFVLTMWNLFSRRAEVYGVAYIQLC